MEIKKAEIKDLNLVVKMKMDMFREVGSIVLLQDNAEEKIFAKYKELYQEENLCHYLIYEDDNVVACGGAIIKEDVPFCFFKTPMYGYIMDVYCVPEKRRNGYSSRIMEELIGWLQGKEIHNIKLKPSAKGRGLYEKLGFGNSGEMELWLC
ncbi:MAG: GNAT family N-acetyltransferase [Oscillospiraceae bacterium]|nr:GNAT family N-acetyltransferase [Oscillospiraceae bacterium]